MRFNRLKAWAILSGITLLIAVLSSGHSGKVPNSPVAATYATLPQVAAGDLELRVAEGLVYFNGLPFTGHGIRYHENGQQAEQTSYVDGKKQGNREQWYADGAPKLRIEYREGRYHGVATAWWANGNMRSEGNYVQGKVDGTYRQWYRNGGLFKEMNYDHGQETGLQRAWRENGKLYNNYEARNGRIFGLKRANLCYELNDEEI